MRLADRARAGLAGRRTAVGAGGPRQRSAAVAQLGLDGCPACNLAEESAARWIGYFIAEGNAEGEVVRALRASLGPCPRHTRRMVAAPGGADVFARTAVDLARAALRGTGMGDARAPCPACAREAWAMDHATTTVLRELVRRGGGGAEPALERRSCLPHLIGALSRNVHAEGAVKLAGAGAAALREAEGEDLVLRVCGRDADATARADLLRTVAMPARGPVLRRWVLSWMAVDACPSCLAERQAVRGALEWLATSTALEPWELRLCAGHLGTLHALDALTGRRVAAALAAEWSAALGRYAAAAAGPSGRGPLARLRARRASSSALQNLLGNRACRACDVAGEAGARAGELLLAAIADPELAAAYGRSHGLCLHHVSALPVVGQDGLPLKVLRARLALLRWELEEAERKRSWFARWEPAGSEAGAWRRLPGLLGGADAGFPGAAPFGAG